MVVEHMSWIKHRLTEPTHLPKHYTTLPRKAMLSRAAGHFWVLGLDRGFCWGDNGEHGAHRFRSWDAQELLTNNI